jgi:hypothetical protein
VGKKWDKPGNYRENLPLMPKNLIDIKTIMLVIKYFGKSFNAVLPGFLPNFINLFTPVHSVGKWRLREDRKRSAKKARNILSSWKINK